MGCFALRKKEKPDLPPGALRFFADDSELRTICGSPLYVAPEILDIGTSSETVTFHICCSYVLPNYMQRQNM